MIRFEWAVATDVGRVRAVNQDNAIAREGLFAVADGMGGHRGGEIASDIAVRQLESHEPIVSTADLIDAIRRANESIIDAAGEDPSLEGMGTTVCAIALVHADGQERLAIANVGDSRVYALAHDGAELQQLTDDHSLVAQLVREGSIKPADADRHPQRNVLTRALGVDPDVTVDAWEITANAGDRFVLCSDGLYNEITDDQIAAVLRRLDTPRDAADELMQLANANGGRDNITVVVVHVTDADPASGSAAAFTKARVPDVAGFATAAANGGDAIAFAEVAPDPASPNGAHEPVVEIREPRPPLFTVRTALFVFALAVIGLGAFFGIVWMKNHTFVVKYDEEGNVAIYRGKVLWYGEELLEVPNRELTRQTLAETDNVKVDAGHRTDSRNKARAFVDQLAENRKRVDIFNGTSTTTTTTITLPPATSPPATVLSVPTITAIPPTTAGLSPPVSPTTR